MKKSYQSLEDTSIYFRKPLTIKNFKHNTLLLSLALIFIFSFSLQAQEGDPTKGKQLFNTNCAACHRLDKPLTGPALRNVEQRLADEQGLDRAWIDAWIRNSAALIKSGDPYAVKIFAEWNNTAMTAMPQLSDQDITDILAYTAEPAPEPVVVDAGGGEGGTGQSSGISNELILTGLAVLFILLAFGLYTVNQTLRRFAKANDIEFEEKEKGRGLWQAFVQNQFLLLVTAIFLLLSSGYYAYGYLMQVGVDQGYAPVQPIHYSHRVHAGDNGIDCKYCHSSARVSKTSGIPSLNVCMNCHKSISEVAPETLAEGQEYGIDYNAEIQKLYTAVGWDGVEYTGETQAVKWIRVHNLPDFAYFNHSQHVTVGGIECQTCHGPVEEMEILYQHSPLTMGWCINCHRETNVQVKDNAYYEKIHEELSKKYGVDQLTVAQMGGMECGKCHY